MADQRASKRTLDPTGGSGPWRCHRGQVVPLFAGLVVIGALLAFGLARLGTDAAARAQARSAADAAALAGAAEGRSAADQIAEANGADLVRFVERGSDVVVQVRVGPATATARARRLGGGRFGDPVDPRALADRAAPPAR